MGEWCRAPFAVHGVAIGVIFERWFYTLNMRYNTNDVWTSMDIYGIKYPCQFSGPAQQVVNLIIWVWLPDLVIHFWIFLAFQGGCLGSISLRRWVHAPWEALGGPVHFRYNLVVLKNPDDRSCGWRLSISNYVAPIVPYLQRPFHKVPVETLEMLQLDRSESGGFSLEKTPWRVSRIHPNKWMRTGGSLISGNLHLLIKNCSFFFQDSWHWGFNWFQDVPSQ